MRVVRVAVPKAEDADALPQLVRLSPIPVIADIHFNASLALRAIAAGVAAVRIKPGNIGGPEKVAAVVLEAKRAQIPMRIGANSGSLPKHLNDLAQQDQAEALVEAALEQVRLLEQLDFHDFKLSVKSSHVPTMIRAYRMLAEKVPYPVAPGRDGGGNVVLRLDQSAVGIGALLADGIGDTLRVSLTADPTKEAKVAREILRTLKLRERGPIIVACPSCGRDTSACIGWRRRWRSDCAPTNSISRSLCWAARLTAPARRAMLTSASPGGRGVGFLYAHGRPLRKVASEILIDELFEEIDK